ncbi:MYG1 family protein, partial [bacterium]|nr:MYG1 family protein [bacterium]
MLIVTHNEKFHADEIFACASLLLIFPDSEIIRSRDENDFRKADIRVDVGEKNNPETLDFDHHQRGGAGYRENGFPYASFGLVWKEFGKKICKNEEISKKIDRKLVQTIDALDFGYDFFTYSDIYPYTISDMISAFNPSWEE